jgi:hypothetical protein
MKEKQSEIKKMPDRETLEAFLRGFHGKVDVVFNLEKGVFEWVVPRPDQPGEPKTELGEKLKRL